MSQAADWADQNCHLAWSPQNRDSLEQQYILASRDGCCTSQGSRFLLSQKPPPAWHPEAQPYSTPGCWLVSGECCVKSDRRSPLRRGGFPAPPVHGAHRDSPFEK